MSVFHSPQGLDQGYEKEYPGLERECCTSKEGCTVLAFCVDECWPANLRWTLPGDEMDKEQVPLCCEESSEVGRFHPGQEAGDCC